MNEVILGVIVFALLGVLVWEKWENKKERGRFINALISKTPEQYRDLELTEKVKPITPPINPPEFVPEADIPDEEFKEMIKETNA